MTRALRQIRGTDCYSVREVDGEQIFYSIRDKHGAEVGVLVKESRGAGYVEVDGDARFKNLAEAVDYFTLDRTALVEYARTDAESALKVLEIKDGTQFVVRTADGEQHTGTLTKIEYTDGGDLVAAQGQQFPAPFDDWNSVEDTLYDSSLRTKSHFSVEGTWTPEGLALLVRKPWSEPDADPVKDLQSFAEAGRRSLAKSSARLDGTWGRPTLERITGRCESSTGAQSTLGDITSWHHVQCLSAPHKGHSHLGSLRASVIAWKD